MQMPENEIVLGDSIQALKKIPANTVHLILSDIPYGIAAAEWDVLHHNTNSALRGKSPAQKKAGAVFKSRGKPINGWSEADRAIPREYYEWCCGWAGDWLRVLKPGGSAIVFAGRRLAHRCVAALEDAGFSFKDMIAWVRDRAPHRAQRLSVVFDRRGDNRTAREWTGWRLGNLRPTFEPILWFTKPYQIGATIADNVLAESVGAFNEKAFTQYTGSPDNIIHCALARSEGGHHPTQKPVQLLQALVELTTKKDQLVLDPFCGSGSTLLAAQSLGRRYLGIEISTAYVKVARARLGTGKLVKK